MASFENSGFDDGDQDDLSELTFSPGMRRAVFVILAIAGLSVCVGRVITVRSKDSRGPFLSANDRSRWCTIRNLVEQNTFVIDGLQRDPQWQTIDKVQHLGRDGKLHSYSSKPPLYPTLIAGQYWVINRLTGASFKHHPFPLTRVLLVVNNVLPLAIYFWLMIGLIRRFCDTDWARLFATVAMAFGTFLTTLTVTLSNHLPAAICTLIALHVFIAIWYDERTSPWLFVVAGLAAAFTAVNELPALSFLCLLGLALLYKDWRRTLLFGVPAVAAVAAGFFVMNYVAHDSWRPPYAHRNSDVEGIGANGDDNWYDYEGSYWSNPDKKGVDAGEPSKVVYATQSLIGHHGVLSLTPIWCLSLVGILLLASRERELPMPALAIGIVLLTVVCTSFYLFLRPVKDMNYGGVSCGFRWLFWFTPLWFFAMFPALDRIAHSPAWRRVAYVLLAISILSATYPSANPWQHPWPYQLAEYLGWVS